MKKRNPRHGSMQFWPRVRAKREHARVGKWFGDKNSILGFAGYKVGMTHVLMTDNKATSKSKGEDIFCPVTIVECPPLKVVAIRFYKRKIYGTQPASQINASNLDKDLSKTICLPKKEGKNIDDIKDYNDITLVVHTQPKLTGIGKKKPEIFEIAVGGKLDEKLAYAKEKLGKDIGVSDVFLAGEQVDMHAVTKGKGFQGAVKRFGITIRSHKSEKDIRNPGSLGGWKAQGHVMYRIAHAGQTGYHKRTEYNKWIVKIGKDAKDVQQKGGCIHYGTIKNEYVLLKGSIAGARKRLVKFSHARKPDHRVSKEAPSIPYISTESKQ